MPQDPEQQTHISKKIGSTMTLLAWLVFLGLLTLLFGNILDRQENPNNEVISLDDNGSIEVTLIQNRSGHYVAVAKFNNTPVNIIIDTGATDVSVPEAIADKIGLRRGAVMEVSTANGTIPVYATKIDSIQLGQITSYNIRANINPHMEENYVLLGMSFLENMEITQSRGKMVLRHNKL
ncbi:MAG: aspartyl protease family protein [Gammaproteobacteria bacterium]|jgi:aspartyl protease family protein